MIDQMNISEVYDLESYETAFVEEDPFHEIGQQLVLEEMKNFKIAEPRVLEIGGGSGLFTLRLAAACPNARITVIEPDKEWFRVLRERTEGLPNIRTKRARIEELNSPRNYHVCCAILAFHHIPYEKQLNAIAEVFSLLKPEGSFVILDKFIPHFENEQERIAALKTSHGYFLRWKKQRKLWKGFEFEVTSLRSNLSKFGDYKVSPFIFEREFAPYFKRVKRKKVAPGNIEADMIVNVPEDLKKAGFSVSKKESEMIKRNLESPRWGTFVYILQRL